MCTLHVARASVVTLPTGGSGSSGGGVCGSSHSGGGNGGAADDGPSGVKAICIELVGDRFLRK